jgi:hypothetical protein
VKENDNREDLAAYGRIILKLTLRKYDMTWIRQIWLRIGTSGWLFFNLIIYFETASVV